MIRILVLALPIWWVAIAMIPPRLLVPLLRGRPWILSPRLWRARSPVGSPSLSSPRWLKVRSSAISRTPRSKSESSRSTTRGLRVISPQPSPPPRSSTPRSPWPPSIRRRRQPRGLEPACWGRGPTSWSSSASPPVRSRRPVPPCRMIKPTSRSRSTGSPTSVAADSRPRALTSLSLSVTSWSRRHGTTRRLCTIRWRRRRLHPEPPSTHRTRFLETPGQARPTTATICRLFSDPTGGESSLRRGRTPSLTLILIAIRSSPGSPPAHHEPYRGFLVTTRPGVDAYEHS